MSEITIAESLECNLANRILLTLHIADRRGYGMSQVHISKMLIYGEAEEEEVRLMLSSMPLVSRIWEAEEALPFMRQDKYMAYELFRQKPIMGLDFYRQVLENNRWLETFFPLIYNGSSYEQIIKKTFIARVLRFIYSNPVISYLGEKMFREISSFLWRLVQFSRRNNPEAPSGVRWVTEMQKPYALFGDRI